MPKNPFKKAPRQPPEPEAVHLAGLGAPRESAEVEASTSRTRSFGMPGRRRRSDDDIEVRMHPNLMERRAEEIKRRTETREVGGDLSVLTRKDDFYQPVACLLALAAFASFVVSITIIETYITPATDNLDLALRDCSVHLVGVVDKDRVPLTDWTVQSGLPFPTKEEIGHGVLSCWHKCEKEDGACGNVVAERGYGYCERPCLCSPLSPRAATPNASAAGVQLNVTFPVEQSVKADSLVTSDSVSSDNASNATDGIACSGNCTNATDASAPPPPRSSERCPPDGLHCSLAPLQAAPRLLLRCRLLRPLLLPLGTSTSSSTRRARW